MTQAVSVEDSSNPAYKLKINSDGSINTSGGGGGGGGGAVTIADGANVAQGTTTDAAYSGSGAGTEIALLKKLVAQLATTLGVSGTVTANAGTNLNTSTLALESGGNLASIKSDADSIATNTSNTATNTSTIITNTTGLATQSTLSSAKTDLDSILTNTSRIPSQGAATTTASTPVNIASDQVVPIKRNCVAVYTLASTTTSGTTQNSGDLTVGPYTEISIDINTTAQSGTNPTIQYFYERKGADNIYYVLWQSAVLTAATNTLSTSIGAGMAYNQSLGLTGRVRWVVGGTSTPTFTMSINVYGK